MPYCSTCGKEVQGAAGYCAGCGTSVAATASNVTVPKPSAADEQVIFNQNGIFVSKSRFIDGGQTYAMAGITSVKMYVETPSKIGPIVAMLFGVLFILGGLESLFRGNIIPFVFGLALFLLGLWIFKKRVPVYSVLLHSSSGEQKASGSQNKEFIGQVIAALNQAIVARG
jgi:hypothetical protein